MRHSPSPLRAVQLKLFHPLVKGPQWEQFAPEIRRQSLRLLARLLHERWARGRSVAPIGETADE